MNQIEAPVIEISESAREALLETREEEGQVTVHVTYRVLIPGEMIRIWPTTYLVPREGGQKSRLLTFHNISMAPIWTLIEKRSEYRFTLIFSALPKDCKIFHLWEDIDQPDPFIIRNIRRNQSDVYEVKLNP